MRRLRARRSYGFTMLEAVVATSCTLLALGIALPAFTAAGDAGDQGATKGLVESETRHALLRIARELENTSTTSLSTASTPRLVISQGDAPVALVQNDGRDMGGFEGTLGGDSVDAGRIVIDAATDVVTGTVGTPLASDAHETTSMGSGARGTTQWGRDRTAEQVGTVAVGSASTRPRHAIIVRNSVVTFQKVAGFGVDASGTPVISWSTPVTYKVIGRKLVRIQDGVTSVICPVCVGFKAEVSDAGTVILTMVSQARTHAKGRVVAEAAQVEVSPRN